MNRVFRNTMKLRAFARRSRKQTPNTWLLYIAWRAAEARRIATC